MKFWRAFWLLWMGTAGLAAAPADLNDDSSTTGKVIYVLPIRNDIDRTMIYLVRRGVKEAIAARADALVIDMDTNGGEVSSTLEIMKILGQFKGPTATYINQKAFSAGAFIAVTTQKIFMTPQSVIGAAAVISAVPGAGAQDLPKTLDVKMTSALSALVRAQAEKNGHNTDVIQAMIDKTKELKIDGELLNKEGNILTLTDQQAAKTYGQPPRPLLSAGTVDSLSAVAEQMGLSGATLRAIEPTGAEKFATWLTSLSPLLLVIGVVGLYIEFKTPGFGLPGIIGITAFAIYFLGGYAAGLSGWEWVLVFLVGLALVAVELFILPGTFFLGLAGSALMLIAIIMALVDLYPNPGPGLPQLPAFSGFNLPLRTLLIAMAGSAAALWILRQILPKTPIYQTIVSHSASGVREDLLQDQLKKARLGQIGVTVSALRPGGKAQFGEDILDVTSQGDFIPPRTRVRVIGFSNNDPMVEALVPA